jgi:alpha-D-ribose 1-methylphosphonate 5-triphosphate synthase subunit PhnH
MNPQQLQQIRAGFHHEAFGSQAVFRSTLQALSHPGRLIAMPQESQFPRTGHPAAAALLLALLDADCTVWLSPCLRLSDAAAWLRFHTGCQLAEEPASAQFLWVGQGDALPPLDTLMLGTDAYPDQSATCVVEVASLGSVSEPAGDEWVLQGPGIDGGIALAARGLPMDFIGQRERNHGAFPRGVDLLLTTPTHAVGLPRTTRVLSSRRA